MDNPYQPPRNEDVGYKADFPEKARPTSVTVFGILNLVFGILGLICTPISIASVFITPLQPGMMNPAPPPGAPDPMRPPGMAENPVLKIMANNPTYRNGTIAFSVVGMVSSAILTAAGVGLLKLKTWGRTLSNAFAVLNILTTIGSLIFNYVVLIAPLLELARKANDPATTGGAVGGAIGGMGGGCISLVYPVLLAIFMNRPVVIEALRRSSAHGRAADF